MRGRASSIYMMMLVGTYPVGGMFMGWLSDLRSAPFAVCLGGIICLLTGLLLWVFPGLLLRKSTVSLEAG